MPCMLRAASIVGSRGSHLGNGLGIGCLRATLTRDHANMARSAILLIWRQAGHHVFP